MTRKTIVVTALVAAVAFSSISAVHAQWVKDGTLVYGGTGSNQYARVVADGEGGAVIVWWRGVSYSGDLYAQRIDELGSLLWSAGGVPVCTASGNQINQKVVSDGAGGAIVVWEDHRNGVDSDIYVQRVDASGNALWGTDGMPVAVLGGDQAFQVMISDGAGGVIIAWQDKRSLVDNDVYAQHIDAGGNALWATNGIAVYADSSEQVYPAIASDGSGGAIITWMDNRNALTYDLYAQRIDGAGNLKWAATGMVVCDQTSSQNYPRIVSDGAHGAIVAWQDDRSLAGMDVYAQRISYDGWRIWPWAGVAICTAAGWQSGIVMMPDDTSGSFIAWEDNRGSHTDIYAQHVDENGSALWTTDGVGVRIGSYDDACCPSIVSDGMGGIILTWEDVRIVGDEDIYAQRLDGNGNARWQANGIAVCKEVGRQLYPGIAYLGLGNTIVTWDDPRNGAESVYAQRIENNFGYWGNVAGQIRSVGDIANDQGGRVEVKWDASRLDVFGNGTVTHYSIWRAVPPAKAASFTGSGIVDPSTIGMDFAGPAYRVERTSGGTYYWEWVGNTTAQYFPGYSYAVPTLSDSTASHPAVHYFEILTHTSNPYVFWASVPDSGYSVDNLSPAPPQGLAGDYSYALGSLTLNWKSNTEADLSHYAVYRGVGAGFVPSDQNRIATSADTTVGGLPYPPEQPYYIKLSAVDIHGNESPFAVLPPESVTTPTMVTAFESSWKAGYVEVSWEMSEDPASVDFLVERKGGSEARYHEVDPNISLEGRRASFRDGSVEPGRRYTYRVSSRKEGVERMLFETGVSIPAARLVLHQSYPNPFKSETEISFELPRMMNVELSVFDARGRKVAELARGRMDAGLHKVPFRADEMASGVYFYKLRAGDRTLSRKLIIMR